MIKLDIISGFLGAGKTTFAKKYLAALKERGERAVYLVNDFGNSIDDRIAGADTAEALDNGCICCTLKADFLAAVARIASGKPDRIVFETSGVFLFSDLMSDISGVKLNAIITVADGKFFFDELDEFGFFMENQFKYCTHALISKCGDAERFAVISEKLRGIAPHISIIPRTTDELTPADFAFSAAPPVSFEKAKPHFAPDCFSKDFYKDCPPVFVTKAANCFRQGLFGDVIRAKAIIKSGGKCIVLNVVRKEISIERTGTPITFSRVAVMGANLNFRALERLFCDAAN